MIFFDTTLSSFAFPVLLSKFRNVVQLPKKIKQISTSQVQDPHTGVIKLELSSINLKTVDAIHLITGPGATLLPFSPEVREVALVWRAILVALTLKRLFYGISSKRELLKTSVIAKAYVQSTNILSYLYKTEVFTEIWDN